VFEFFCSAYYFNIINVTLICSKKILTVALLFVQLFYKIRSSISGPILVDGCALWPLRLGSVATLLSQYLKVQSN